MDRSEVSNLQAHAAGETGFEVFDAERTSLFELLCRSRAFWFGFAFWVGATVGLSAGFLLGVRAVVSW